MNVNGVILWMNANGVSLGMNANGGKFRDEYEWGRPSLRMNVNGVD
jgi:hypothetical protein